MLTLIIGGARSGKSRFAQSLCPPDGRVAFVATATIGDEEMRQRVERHRRERPSAWLTVEEPLAVDEALGGLEGRADHVIVDCVTLWLSNLCLEHEGMEAAELEAGIAPRLAAIARSARSMAVVVVTNEVGSGIVPDRPIARVFQDLQGWTNQQLALEAAEVYQMVAGIPVAVKSERPSLA